MAGGKRKRATSPTGEPTNEPTASPSSSPLKPLSQQPPRTDKNPFNPIRKLSFPRQISADLPQSCLFDIFALFCPRPMLESWAKYMNSRYIKLPKHVQGPRQEHCRQHTWKDTSADELYLFFGVLIYMTVHLAPKISTFWSTSTKDPIHPISRFI